MSEQVEVDELTQAGRFLRDRCAQPDSERAVGDPVRQSRAGYVPCAREHQPGRLCIRPVGHGLDMGTEEDA